MYSVNQKKSLDRKVRTGTKKKVLREIFNSFNANSTIHFQKGNKTNNMPQ